MPKTGDRICTGCAMDGLARGNCGYCGARLCDHNKPCKCKGSWEAERAKAMRMSRQDLADGIRNRGIDEAAA